MTVGVTQVSQQNNGSEITHDWKILLYKSNPNEARILKLSHSVSTM